MLTLISFFTLMFLLSAHPLALGGLLMIFSLIYGALLALNSFSTWMSYMLIMVFLSGMMIILLYMTSLSSNENIKMSFKKSAVSFGVLILFMFLELVSPLISLNKTNTKDFYFSSTTFELVYKTYSTLLSSMTLLTIVYLLIVLIVAVNIVSLSKGPLKMNK